MWIMTKTGWKPLQSDKTIPRPTTDVFKNPFRSWQTSGAKSYRDWIAR